MNGNCEAATALLSIEECQNLDAPLREELELLDYEIRSIVTRISADMAPFGADDGLFLKASTTVLLSIAAGLMQRAAEETKKPFDTDSFVVGAQSAAQWAMTRKLRYLLAGEA
jgi:hypothetical protein